MRPRARTRGKAAAVCLAAVLLGGCKWFGKKTVGGEPPKPPVVATVGGEDIYTGDFADALRRIGPSEKINTNTPEGRRAVLDRLIGEKLLYLESRKRGLDKDPEIARILRLFSQQVLVQGLLQRIGKEPVTDEEVRKYYEGHKADFTSSRSRFSLILKRKNPGTSPKEQEKIARKVRELYKKLKGGADFAQLAKKESEDPRSSQEGGDLAYSSLSRWSPKVADAGEKLAVGEISEPIEVAYGWIILKRTEAAQEVAAPISEVKPRIAELIQKARIEKVKEEVRREAEVKVYDNVLAGLEAARGASGPNTSVQGPVENPK